MVGVRKSWTSVDNKAIGAIPISDAINALAAPGLDKEDFKVHVDADNNLHIEMEKKTDNKEGKKHARSSNRRFCCPKTPKPTRLRQR